MPVRKASIADIANLTSLTSCEGHAKDEGYFERCFLEQSENLRAVFVAETDEAAISAYCFYNRHPRYQPFRSLRIPEIQDVYVHPRQRRQGLATQLIDACCNLAIQEGHDLIGIGVGLYSNYGKAQKLYVKLGFEPDGGGVVYERKVVIPGQAYKLDDELCLMMIKKLE